MGSAVRGAVGQVSAMHPHSTLGYPGCCPTEVGFPGPGVPHPALTGSSWGSGDPCQLAGTAPCPQCVLGPLPPEWPSRSKAGSPMRGGQGKGPCCGGGLKPVGRGDCQGQKGHPFLSDQGSVSSWSLGWSPPRLGPRPPPPVQAAPTGVSRGHGGDICQVGTARLCPPTDTSPRRAQAQHPLLPRAGSGVVVVVGTGPAGQAVRRAQPLGHRRVKAPRLQRKSGSGCSGLGSTDTRRLAPRWFRGMQSDTRTSRARPCLRREGGKSVSSGQRPADPRTPADRLAHP